MSIFQGRSVVLAVGVVVMASGALVAADQLSDQTRTDEEIRSPVHRPKRERDRSGDDRMRNPPPPGPAVFPDEFRTIDGTGNNVANPEWGAVGIEFLRLAPADYADGVGSPSGASRPSARAVSNAVHAQTGSIDNSQTASSYLWQWGQFLDHDIDETPVTSGDGAESHDIAVPAGDPFFDPFNTGAVTIPLTRSAFSMDSGVRQQLNNITAFIDASNVYGSEDHRAEELRTMDGSGRLKLSQPGNLLPYNTAGLDNAPTSADPSFFLAGDIRANEQVGLISMHTLFVREHNWHAANIAQANPALTGDEIYEHARAIVAAEMQRITYAEFLPLLLGPGALPPYSGYKPSVNPGISNVFATAAYRVGHTMLNSDLLRLSLNSDEIPEGHISLAAAFFAPSEIELTNIDPVLRGLGAQLAQNIDRHVIDEVRNFLFGPPGSGGFDLASLNIQRGRDHGLPSYNDLRVAFGMPPAQGFGDPMLDPDAGAALASVYASVDDVDAWSGMLSEKHKPGALVGELLFRVLRDQFLRLRDGDRFWYEAYLPSPMRQMVDDTRLSDIIRRNTTIRAEIQMDVFRAAAPEPDVCECDMNNDGWTDIFDFTIFANNFGRVVAGGSADGDFDGNGMVDVVDFAYMAADFGCVEDE